MVFLINLTCDVKVVHVLVLKLSDLTTCTVQIQSFSRRTLHHGVSGVCLQMLTEVTYTTARLFGVRAEIALSATRSRRTAHCTARSGTTRRENEAGVLPTGRQVPVLLGVSTKQECFPLDGKVWYYSVCTTADHFDYA